MDKISKMNLDEKEFSYIKKITEELKKYNPSKIILFGSRARGDYSKVSDIDIAVDLKLSFREKRKLRDKLDKLVGLYSLDLVFLNEVENNFKKQIFKEGVILYEKKWCVNKSKKLWNGFK